LQQSKQLTKLINEFKDHTCIKIYISACCRGLFIIICTQGNGRKKDITTDQTCRYILGLGIRIISIIAFVVRAHRWNLLIEPMGYSPSLKNTTYAVTIGYFANLAFPRLGEVSRCGALSKAESIPFQ
jgi:hypothetical protein